MRNREASANSSATRTARRASRSRRRRRLPLRTPRPRRGARLARQQETAPRTQPGAARRPILVHHHLGKIVIIEPRAAQSLVFEHESQRPHQMQPRPGVGRQPDHVAGVGRNLRLEKDDLEHSRHPVRRTGEAARASTIPWTAAAPDSSKTSANAFNVAPVVSTSSTTPTRRPAIARARSTAKAPRRSSRRAEACRRAWCGVPRRRCTASSRTGRRHAAPKSR